MQMYELIIQMYDQQRGYSVSLIVVLPTHRGFGLKYWRRPVISLYIVLYKGTLLLKTLTFCKEFESAGEFINIEIINP